VNFPFYFIIRSSSFSSPSAVFCFHLSPIYQLVSKPAPPVRRFFPPNSQSFSLSLYLSFYLFNRSYCRIEIFPQFSLQCRQDARLLSLAPPRANLKRQIQRSSPKFISSSSLPIEENFFSAVCLVWRVPLCSTVGTLVPVPSLLRFVRTRSFEYSIPS